MNYKYKFSIIIAIYNTEQYLEEAINSVIGQNIGFENVQLILVNDGSSDNSDFLCSKYDKLYENVVYLNLEHKGVSNARNEGLKYSNSKYVNFLDSDDKFEKNVLDSVYTFFEENYEKIDFVSIPLYFFDYESGEHILNSKFIKNGIIDIEKEYQAIQLSSSSSFFKSDVLKKNYFDKKLEYAEDASLLSKLVLKKYKYGIVSDVKYFYRKRKDFSSAIQNSGRRKSWYIDYINNFSLGLLTYSKKECNYIPKYIQYIVMYDLVWRINEFKNIDNILSKSEKQSFFEIFNLVLSQIEDKIIFEQTYLKYHRKILLYILKRIDSTFIKKYIIMIISWHK
ncbi:glycosyltransferase family 2 protein [Clostridioides difficile]|nr:glycosyltransferase family 2 protein [Clostridioides difficile]